MGIEQYYTHQFVQNEVLTETINADSTVFAFNHGEILEGTVTGVISCNSNPVWTFATDMNGNLESTSIPMKDLFTGFDHFPRKITGRMDYKLGILNIDTQNVDHGFRNKKYEIKVNYEYPMVCETSLAIVPKMPFVNPTFDNFLTSAELLDIAENASTVSVWDFHNSLGDTIMEKYESLYVKLVEINNVLLSKGARGYFWIVASREITSIFETATAGFSPNGLTNEPMIGGVIGQGLSDIAFLGSVNRRWRVYFSDELPKNCLIMGCNDKVESYHHYAKLNICNFMI